MIISIIAGLLVGLLVGGLGGGGAILTVPVLVFAFGQSAHEATTSSLVIVGLSAFIGLWPHQRQGNVQWGQGVLFGLIGIVGSFIGTQAARGISGPWLMTLFAALLVVVAVLMIRKALTSAQDVECEAHPLRDGAGHLDRTAAAKVAVTATGVGLLTGFFGVGGGFAIVPALILALGYCMPFAVGTSLVVIAINSVTAYALHASSGSSVDWSIVGPFALAAIVGALSGGNVMSRIPKKYLQLGFAAFLILVSLYTAYRSIPAL